MRQLLPILPFAALLACGGSTAPSDPPSQTAAASSVEEEVEAAVRKHLSTKSNLDMSAMDLIVQNVDVQGDTAVATVGFQVKGAPESAMSMKYNLAKENGEWVVQANPSGHGGVGTPPNPPPAGQSGQELPPGHPPVAQ